MKYLDKITFQLIDKYYKTKEKVDQFKKENVNELVLFSARGNGRETMKEENMDIGFKWALARQGELILTDKRIVFNKWNIEIEQIANAQYSKITGILNDVLVLKIKTKENRSFQIGTIYNSEILNQNVLNFHQEEVGFMLKYFGRIIRLYFIGMIVFYSFKNIFF